MTKLIIFGSRSTPLVPIFKNFLLKYKEPVLLVSVQCITGLSLDEYRECCHPGAAWLGLRSCFKQGCCSAGLVSIEKVVVSCVSFAKPLYNDRFLAYAKRKQFVPDI